MWWALADAVLVFHIGLFVALGVGVLLAALGWLRRWRRTAAVFWPVLVVSQGWQGIPGCALTDIERWLRRQVAPDWDRDMSIARTLTGEVTGFYPSELFFAALAALLGATAIYAFVRFHLRDTLALLSRSRRPAGG